MFESLSFNNRIYFIDNILSLIYSNNYHKFIFLSIVHYLFFFILALFLIFNKNLHVITTIFFFYIIIFFFNIIDNGCILMKLERKYIGKHWYGPYNIYQYFFPNANMIHDIPYIFYFYSFSLFFIFILKLFLHYSSFQIV